MTIEEKSLLNVCECVLNMLTLLHLDTNIETKFSGKMINI